MRTFEERVRSRSTRKTARLMIERIIKLEERFTLENRELLVAMHAAIVDQDEVIEKLRRDIKTLQTRVDTVLQIQLGGPFTRKSSKRG